MSADRISYDDNGASLDEIVMEGVTFHMERTSHHGWYLTATPPDGRTLSVHWQATGEPVVDHEHHELVETHPPLLYHTGALWTGAHGVEHRCEIGSGRDHADRVAHARCRCECGATTWKNRT